MSNHVGANVPLLYNFVLNQLKKDNSVKFEPLRPDKRANVLLIDGVSLITVLYPPTLDWIIPPWREMYNRVATFSRRLTELGFQLVVFFDVKPDEDNMDAKRRYLIERAQIVNRVVSAVEQGASIPEDAHSYFTPVRSFVPAIVKAFQACPGVTVKTTSKDVSRAIAIYCLQHKASVFAVLGTELSEALILPVHSLVSLHPTTFNWDDFWKGKPLTVAVIKRWQVYQVLVPHGCLPVFATLVGNPCFSRERLQGFYTTERDPNEIFARAKQFILKASKEVGSQAPEQFGKRVLDCLTVQPLSSDEFLTTFRHSCEMYTVSPEEEIPEVSVDMIFKQSFFFVEPSIEGQVALPAQLLLRPLRMKLHHLQFGAMTYAELWVRPAGNVLTTDYLSVPSSHQDPDEIKQLPLLRKLNIFETITEIDLEPLLKFSGDNIELSSPSEAWLYLTLTMMSRLDARLCFRRRDELLRLIAQFVAVEFMGDQSYGDERLRSGVLTIDRVSLAHMFHCTLQHLSRLNSICGHPFPAPAEWELFDSGLFLMDMDTLMAHEHFPKDTFEDVLALVENHLYKPLADMSSPTPSEAQIHRPPRQFIEAPILKLGACPTTTSSSPPIAPPLISTSPPSSPDTQYNNNSSKPSKSGAEVTSGTKRKYSMEELETDMDDLISTDDELSIPSTPTSPTTPATPSTGVDRLKRNFAPAPLTEFDEEEKAKENKVKSKRSSTINHLPAWFHRAGRGGKRRGNLDGRGSGLTPTATTPGGSLAVGGGFSSGFMSPLAFGHNTASTPMRSPMAFSGANTPQSTISDRGGLRRGLFPPAAPIPLVGFDALTDSTSTTPIKGHTSNHASPSKMSSTSRDSGSSGSSLGMGNALQKLAQLQQQMLENQTQQAQAQQQQLKQQQNKDETEEENVPGGPGKASSLLPTAPKAVAVPRTQTPINHPISATPLNSVQTNIPFSQNFAASPHHHPSPHHTAAAISPSQYHNTFTQAGRGDLVGGFRTATPATAGPAQHQGGGGTPKYFSQQTNNYAATPFNYEYPSNSPHFGGGNTPNYPNYHPNLGPSPRTRRDDSHSPAFGRPMRGSGGGGFEANTPQARSPAGEKKWIEKREFDAKEKDSFSLTAAEREGQRAKTPTAAMMGSSKWVIKEEMTDKQANKHLGTSSSSSSTATTPSGRSTPGATKNIKWVVKEQHEQQNAPAAEKPAE